jgi:hypothetical protein
MLAEGTGEPTAALAFLKQRGGMTPDTEATCATKLRSWLAETSAAEKTRLVEKPSKGMETLANKAAHQFLEEQDLEDWIHTQNTRKGLTPRSAVVLRKLSKMRASKGQNTGRRRKRKYDLQWLRRWRARWSCKLAALQPREHVSPPRMREKAPPRDTHSA